MGIEELKDIVTKAWQKDSWACSKLDSIHFLDFKLNTIRAEIADSTPSSSPVSNGLSIAVTLQRIRGLEASERLLEKESKQIEDDWYHEYNRVEPLISRRKSCRTRKETVAKELAEARSQLPPITKAK